MGMVVAQGTHVIHDWAAAHAGHGGPSVCVPRSDKPPAGGRGLAHAGIVGAADPRVLCLHVGSVHGVCGAVSEDYRSVGGPDGFAFHAAKGRGPQTIGSGHRHAGSRAWSLRHGPGTCGRG